MFSMDRRFPGIPAMRRATRRRIPHFAWEYLNGGIGRDLGKRHNRNALDRVKLMPRYLGGERLQVETSVSVLGQDFSAPFGVAPIGLGGLMWPKAAEYLAEHAAKRNIPFCLSTFATTTPGVIAEIAGKNAWFQLYEPNDPEIREDVIRSAEKAGFETMLLTVDIPSMTRREREIAVGLALPPDVNIINVAQMMVKPRWCAATLNCGIPRFKVFKDHVAPTMNNTEEAFFLTKLVRGHRTLDQLKALRDRWPGKLLIKGLLAREDVARAREIGYDGVVVSNHGGRQLESALSAVEVLPRLRKEFPDYTLLADSGVRCGADIAKMIALGANMVLCGRAMMYGVCAAGKPGAAHVMSVLQQELEHTLGQLGVAHPDQLHNALVEPRD